MKKGHKQKQPAVKKEAVKQSDRLFIALIAAAIVVTTYLSFAPALNGNFTNWDDDTYVTGNEIIKSASIDWPALFKEPVALNYHPVTMLTFAMNYKAAGLEPHAYHSTNLFLHILNSILIFIFFYFLSGKKLLTGAITGLIFAIHPMHVESVAWISERKDVLYVFFLMLALISYLRYRINQQAAWLLLTFLFFMLSCLSKAMAVVLPLLLIAIDYFQQRRFTLKVWLEKVPFLIVSLVFGILALRIQADSTRADIASFSIFQQFLFGCYGFLAYLVKFVLPVKLSAFYPYPISNGSQQLPILFYLSPLLLGAVALLIYRYLRNQLNYLFGIAWFIISIVLVLQFISVGNALMADRYSYLSYAGLAFMTAYGFDNLYRSKPGLRMALSIMLACILLTLCFATNSRSKVWNNSETLWSDVINKYPGTPTAYKNRGNFYGENGNSAAALKDYNMLLSMKTTDAEVYNNLGNIYAGQKKVTASIEAYSKAISLKPDYINAYTNRGISYNEMGQPAKAIEDFSKAIALNERSAPLLAQRGYTYFTSGNYAACIADFSKAIELQPDLAAAWYCRGLANYRTNENVAAIQDLTKARSLGYQGDYALLESLQAK
jgi:tetratricopeptide (TPR) repeat protein